MTESNPFALPEAKFIGRKEELDIFERIVESTSAKQPELTVIRGGIGVGKTTLMNEFEKVAAKKGMLTVHVKAERREKIEDVVDKLYYELLHEKMRAGLTQNNLRSFVKTLEERMVEGIFGAVVFVDCVDNMPKPEEAIAEANKIINPKMWRRRVTFVFTTKRKIPLPEEVKELLIKPFNEKEAHDFVNTSLRGKKMGDECFNSIFEDTNGNPRLIRGVCKYVYERLREDDRIITKGHYLAALPYIMSRLSREWFGGMYQETPKAERTVLIAIAHTGKTRITKVSATLGKPPGPTNTLARRLLERGELVQIERGEYAVFSKLYGRYVIQRS